ncbi:MAG: SulP family inorganic anion transporter, partial [Oscillospiraceae bacterium]
IKKYVNDLKTEFSGYSASRFSKDLMAGLTVTAVALPLALAFGVSCGADAAAGLISAIIAGFVIAALSGASFQVSGPTGTMTAILIGIVTKFDIQALFIVGLLSGFVLLIASFLKLGKLVSFIPSAVITGFTSGIAVIIALGQIDNFFGVSSSGDSAISKLFSYGKLGFTPNMWAVGIALLVIAIMVFYPKKLAKILPSSLAAIIVCVVINMIFELPLAIVGEIPRTLFPKNRLDITAINMEQIATFILPAISIAALCMIETLLSGASGSRMKNEKFDADRELISQGIGNIIIPLFGGVPASAVLARTSVGIKSGGQTRLTSIIHSFGLLTSMFLLGSIMSQIPLSALSGVIMVTAYKMNDWDSIKYIFKKRFRASIAQFAMTMLATVAFDLTIAIVIGITVSILIFIVRISNVEVESSEVDYEKLKISDDKQKEKLDSITVTYITGPIFFGSVEKIDNEIRNIGEHKILILSMRGVPMIDSGAAQMILERIEDMSQNGITVLFCGLQSNAKQMLKRAGVIELISENNFFWDAQQAIESCI